MADDRVHSERTFFAATARPRRRLLLSLNIHFRDSYDSHSCCLDSNPPNPTCSPKPHPPTPSSPGVQGDQRTHAHVVALRAVTSSDGMTADWYPFKPDFLRHVSTRICNTVRSVNRVVYDITSKPPSTIEWE